ncbi:hypothetical protein DSO57_1019103 [Entomophthora muscae]|uniref:Uncharacterized protein n=1 Tax=Entomophthora muscae TaxID=34485 RepID=A0ACC2UDU1_9FUNG|nr:hypothetical protein DSO57_1019103 [Entomophthora muscae]
MTQITQIQQMSSTRGNQSGRLDVKLSAGYPAYNSTGIRSKVLGSCIETLEHRMGTLIESPSNPYPRHTIPSQL